MKAKDTQYEHLSITSKAKHLRPEKIVHALHVTALGSIPGTVYGPLSTARRDPSAQSQY